VRLAANGGQLTEFAVTQAVKSFHPFEQLDGIHLGRLSVMIWPGG
jgi:hypothetical protein